MKIKYIIPFVLLMVIFLFFIGCNNMETVTTPGTGVSPTPTISLSQEDIAKLKPGQIVEHPPTESNPYYFYTYFPESAVKKKNLVLLVWPHGGGMYSNDYNYHKKQAYYALDNMKSFLEKYKIPGLVCALSRPESVSGGDARKLNSHALNRESFITSIEFYKRPDLKVIDTIWNQYIPFLKTLGFNLDKKIYMMGFSSPGTFAHRFTIIHPEKIKAIWIGSSTTGPLPSDTFQDITITYPLGISDLGELTGNSFDWNIYQNIPQFMVVGSEDTHDFNDPDNPEYFTEDQVQIIHTYFPKERPKRQEFLANYIKNKGGNVIFKMYEGVAHEIPDQMWEDAFDFLISH